MGLKIKSVEIKNFRSCRNLLFEPADLAIVVGRNDSGKSNILRALNLFFNGETASGEEFAFLTDHNVFNQPNRRAKEISIKLEISMPETYRQTNGDYIIWEKRWRANGLVHNKYSGRRNVAGPRGGSALEEIDIPDRSNVHALLRNINFVYVPAIKDIEYFSELQASIYSVIAEVANREFRDSSRAFENSISDQLRDLLGDISSSLGFNSRLALPNDLSHIFESLDFLADGTEISLDSRGDGVKARHIPLILKFMAEKKRSLQVRGAQPHNFIWGYEEPENSLELNSAIQLADQFLEFVEGDITQIIVTTHSPVFYNLVEKAECEDGKISCHHVFRESEEEGTKVARELDDLDERMGATALFAPLAAKIEERLRNQQEADREVERLSAQARRKLFVEGSSDKIFLEKAIEVFLPDVAEQIDIETKNGAGINYVIDMLHSWRSKAKHHLDLPRVAGLLDADSEAKSAAKQWNEVDGNVRSAKCFKLPTPPHIQPPLSAGFKVPVDLEAMYDLEAWNYADQKGWLESRDLPTVLPKQLLNDIIDSKVNLEEELQPEWGIFVKKKFLQEGKSRMAEHFAGKPVDEFRSRFFFLQDLLEQIRDYLFDQPHP